MKLPTFKSAFGYTLFLHKETERFEHGFGYMAEQAAEVEERLALWNSYAAATCPHGAILEGAKCNLCGHKYVLTRVSPEA